MMLLEYLQLNKPGTSFSAYLMLHEQMTRDQPTQQPTRNEVVAAGEDSSVMTTCLCESHRSNTKQHERMCGALHSSRMRRL